MFFLAFSLALWVLGFLLFSLRTWEFSFLSYMVKENALYSEGFVRVAKCLIPVPFYLMRLSHLVWCADLLQPTCVPVGEPMQCTGSTETYQAHHRMRHNDRLPDLTEITALPTGWGGKGESDGVAALFHRTTSFRIRRHSAHLGWSSAPSSR